MIDITILFGCGLGGFAHGVLARVFAINEYCYD